jgi:hypothetical protein
MQNEGRLKRSQVIRSVGLFLKDLEIRGFFNTFGMLKKL